MGTKNNPGAFDCYANAEPDEPMFVLLGRDPVAGLIVEIWAHLRVEMGKDAKDDPIIVEALECAKALNKYAAALGKKDQMDAAFVALVNRVKPVDEWRDSEGG